MQNTTRKVECARTYENSTFTGIFGSAAAGAVDIVSVVEGMVIPLLDILLVGSAKSNGALTNSLIMRRKK